MTFGGHGDPAERWGEKGTACGNSTGLPFGFHLQWCQIQILEAPGETALKREPREVFLISASNHWFLNPSQERVATRFRTKFLDPTLQGIHFILEKQKNLLEAPWESCWGCAVSSAQGRGLVLVSHQNLALLPQKAVLRLGGLPKFAFRWVASGVLLPSPPTLTHLPLAGPERGALTLGFLCGIQAGHQACLILWGSQAPGFLQGGGRRLPGLGERLEKPLQIPWRTRLGPL